MLTVMEKVDLLQSAQGAPTGTLVKTGETPIPGTSNAVFSYLYPRGFVDSKFVFNGSGCGEEQAGTDGDLDQLESLTQEKEALVAELAEVLAASALNRAGGILEADGASAGSAHGAAGVQDGTVWIVWDDNLDLHLRQEAHLILATSVDRRVPTLDRIDRVLH